MTTNKTHGEWEGLNEVMIQKIIQAKEWGLQNDSKERVNA